MTPICRNVGSSDRASLPWTPQVRFVNTYMQVTALRRVDRERPDATHLSEASDTSDKPAGVGPRREARQVVTTPLSATDLSNANPQLPGRSRCRSDAPPGLGGRNQAEGGVFGDRLVSRAHPIPPVSVSRRGRQSGVCGHDGGSRRAPTPGVVPRRDHHPTPGHPARFFDPLRFASSFFGCR